MYLLFIAYFFALGNAVEKCLTPLGQNGECVPLASCKSLLWSFANPKDGMVNYLQKFLCSNDTDNGITVCCRVASDMLVFEDEDDTYDPDSIYNVKKLVNSKTCGIQSGYVQGGGLIGLYDFPWLVKLVIKNNTLDKKDRIDKVACTGILINQRYVLYTAQCHKTVIEEEPNFFARIDSYTGYGANCDTTSSSYTKSCSTFATYEIEEFTLHPFYDPNTKINDIAILRLSRRVPLSEFLHPICLPLMSDLPHLSTVYTAGWNRTFLPTDSTVKSTYTSVAVPNSNCKSTHKLDNVLTTFDMCTIHGTPDKSEVIGYPVTQFYKNQWYILGFTSRGKEPRIHTRVQNYLQWIKESMGGERCYTPFNQTGECIQLTECPSLREAFANAGPEEVDSLNAFVCEYPDEDEDDFSYTLKVCCGDSPNFTVFEREVNETVAYNISNLVFCGFQHRDDYLSADDKISIDEFPWLVAVVNGSLPAQRDFICGGTLITDSYVLTSTQCIRSFEEEDTVLVRLGDYNLKTDVDCFEVTGVNDFECADVQERGVEERIEHPFFNRFQLINDIALLRLDKKVKFSDYVRPICLPKSEEDYLRYNETFYTTGFGDNDRDVKGPKIKKKIPTTLIPLDVCNEKSKLLSAANPTTDYEFCTEDFKNSTDVTCSGDEGGPVMFSKKFQWFIQGISSSFGCRDDEPQTHLKVFKYLRWIKLNIKV